MTREEAVDVLKRTLPYESNFAEARTVAIKSLEAWDKVIKDSTERTVTFIPKRLEENETYDSAFHDGVNYVMDIIRWHLKEVEE